MSADRVLRQVAKLEELRAKSTPGRWWNSHGEPAAGDKSLWDEWEALDANPELPDPEERGRNWVLLFAGDVENPHDTDLIVGAVNALPALLGPGPHPELEAFQERERRLSELALVVLGS